MVDILKLRKLQKSKQKSKKKESLPKEKEDIKNIDPKEVVEPPIETDKAEVPVEIDSAKPPKDIEDADDSTTVEQDESGEELESKKLSIKEILEQKKKEKADETSSKHEEFSEQSSEIENIGTDVIDSKPDAEVSESLGQQEQQSDDLDVNVGMLTMVEVEVSDQPFAIEIEHVREVIRINEITRVPNLSEFYRGVINLRGNVTPVMDLRRHFNMTEKNVSNNSRIVITDINKTQVGLLVDSVSDILKVPESSLEPPPAIVTNVDHKYIKGVLIIDGNRKESKKLVVVLELDSVIPNIG